MSEVSSLALGLNFCGSDRSIELPPDSRTDDVQRFFEQEAGSKVVDCRVMTGETPLYRYQRAREVSKPLYRIWFYRI